MPSRTLLYGFFGAFLTIAALAAQEARDTVGPLEQKANDVTPENPVPRRTKSMDAVYPEDMRKFSATAVVVLIATVDESGRVAEIRKSGPGFERNNPLVLFSPEVTPDPAVRKAAAEAFVQSAATALREWRYDVPAKAPISFAVTFNFTTTTTPTAAQDTSGRKFGAPASVAGGVVGGLSAAPSITGLQPVRVGGQVKPPTQTKKVNPAYPPEALANRVSGVVILEAVIGLDGKVVNATVLRSVPLLDQAAIDAVRQWEYTPTLLNGAPVPIIMTVTVNFSLAPGVPPPPPVN
jgi:TonB family protein